VAKTIEMLAENKTVNNKKASEEKVTVYFPLKVTTDSIQLVIFNNHIFYY
jgi:hypothetical protein